MIPATVLTGIGVIACLLVSNASHEYQQLKKTEQQKQYAQLKAIHHIPQPPKINGIRVVNLEK